MPMKTPLLPSQSCPTESFRTFAEAGGTANFAVDFQLYQTKPHPIPHIPTDTHPQSTYIRTIASGCRIFVVLIVHVACCWLYNTSITRNQAFVDWMITYCNILFNFWSSNRRTVKLHIQR
ncbi:hypothetical protein T02_1085 [Trichinella nativa]|uniref:Uncharacterized protein n=1 Tax=Trichinella nativa TaxID=6335 RepID=A0A0V1LFT9_9BILA|nr:hypothetical protein T02_1085 [Trichinella nativa]